MRTAVESPLHGIIPALVTPLTRDQELDLDKLACFTDFMVGMGIDAITPLGSTGEFYALSAAEREKVLRTVLKAVDGRIPVVPGTNAGATRDVIAFSRQAEKLGCAGVMVAAPYYSLPTPEELLAHFKAVNDAIGIPIVLYNYPGRTGVDMPPEFVARLAEKCCNVRYIKESTGEMPRMAQIQRLCGKRMGVFCGCDTIALQALLMGAVGWVGGVVNVLPRCHVRLYELASQGRYAEGKALFEQFLPVLELMEGGGRYTCWVKAACKLMGHDCGPLRQPLGPATPAELAVLKRALRACRAAEAQ